MKIICSFIAGLLLTASVFAQAPQKMSYQAVIRNSSNALITSTPVGMQISILQDSSTGTPVYVETQTPSTNANGLVSLEIGMGTVVSGIFSTINWANGPYFIKTETDPTGGINYTIVGTNELLSVPYALYSANGTPGPTGATGPQGPAGNDGLSAYQVWLNLGNIGTQTDFINSLTGPQGPIGLTGPAGANGNDGATGATGATGGYPVHYIGESYGGGIVFFVYDGGQHGLIAATADQSTSVEWDNNTNTTIRTFAIGNGIGAGLKNTAIIIGSKVPAVNYNSAALACHLYNVTVGGVTYGDWYLPSLYELDLLYQQQAAVGGFGTNSYWSSTEDLTSSAWSQYFGPGGQNQISSSKISVHPVRAIRAF